MKIAILALASFLLNQNIVPERLVVGTVTSETVRASAEKGGVQEHVPGIIIKFGSQTRRYSAFAMSNAEGIAVAVLAPDRYCVEAFDENRYRVVLDSEQARCFALKEGDTLEVGVVLAASPRK